MLTVCDNEALLPSDSAARTSRNAADWILLFDLFIAFVFRNQCPAVRTGSSMYDAFAPER